MCFGFSENSGWNTYWGKKNNSTCGGVLTEGLAIGTTRKVKSKVVVKRIIVKFDRPFDLGKQKKFCIQQNMVRQQGIRRDPASFL